MKNLSNSFILKIKKFLLKIILHNQNALGSDRSIDLVCQFDKIQTLEGSISKYGSSFLFDAKRLSVSQLLKLFTEIDDLDNYCLNKIQKDGAVVIDVGAHIGVFPFVAVHKLTNSNIYVVEPDVQNMKLAKLNIQNSKQVSPNKIKFFDFALRARPGNADFFTSSKVDWRSSLIENKNFLNHKGIDPTEFTSTYQVDCQTLPYLLSILPEKKIDILKMTIAGQLEADILEASTNAILSKSIEFFALLVYPENESRVKAVFDKLGYQLHAQPRGRTLRVYRKSRV